MDISVADIRKLDMALLLVFQRLMQHRKLTTAAAQLGLTQSAVSQSLKRLREIFGDELFIRRALGVEPTARAFALEPNIAAILDLARTTLRGDADFDLKTVKRVIRIAALDYIVSVFGGPLVAALRTAAPGVSVRVYASVRKDAIAALKMNEVDLAIGMFGRTTENFVQKPLFTDAYSLVCRRSHPVLGDGISLERYLSCDHALVSLSRSDSGIVDQVLGQMGHSRRVVAVLPFFVPTLALVAATDVVTIVPSRLAQHYAKAFALEIHEPPIAIRPVRITSLSHRRSNGDSFIEAIENTILPQVARSIFGQVRDRHDEAWLADLVDSG
jgi:DNA-binding transcriptional LysR family regulator